MNLKILFMFLVYYIILGTFFAFSGSTLTGFSYNGTQVLNSSDIQNTELDDSAGLFNTGISFGRWTSLVTIGLGLSDDTPIWFKSLYSLWSTMMILMFIGFIVSSIWNG